VNYYYMGVLTHGAILSIGRLLHRSGAKWAIFDSHGGTFV
jgi:hypothetical protein